VLTTLAVGDLLSSIACFFFWLLKAICAVSMSDLTYEQFGFPLFYNNLIIHTQEQVSQGYNL
jgi:hypothetical protein